jgi:hypothetical protein
MLAAITISIVLASIASANVSVTVYRCDGKTPLAPKDPNTPHVHSDVMVGTRLVLVVSSDKPWKKEDKDLMRKYGWWGGLQCAWDDWGRGKLLGRGYDPNSLSHTYRDSCLPAAGIPSVAWPHEPIAAFVESSRRVGFELETLPDVVAGDWFVLDYVAENVGSCNVGLFDYWLSFNVPQETLTFNHVPSQDFDGNGIVNFADFASLASQWRQPADPNAAVPRPYDSDADRLIGPSDLAMFADFWLEQTDCRAAPEPTTPTDGL